MSFKKLIKQRMNQPKDCMMILEIEIKTFLIGSWVFYGEEK